MVLHDETIEVQGLSTHILRGGSGVPLLVLHGWGSTAERYRETLRSIPETVVSAVIPDLPGFGATVLPADTWDTHAYAHWTRELLRTLGIPSAVILGHSFGGGIGLALTAQYPELARALILYGARILTHRNPVKLSVFQALAKAGNQLFRLPGLSLFAVPARKLLYRLAGSRDYLSAGNLQPIFRRVVAEDLSALVHRVSVPTGILWGREDRETPLTDAEHIHAILPTSDFRILEGAGHSIHREQPERFAMELLSMIRRLTIV